MTEQDRNRVSDRNSVSKPKVLVVGWDGATWDVIRPLVQQGRLPTMAKLMAQGATGVLRSTLHPLSPQAWTTYETGVNPGKHGIYDWYQLDLGPFRPIGAHSLCFKPYWRYLSDERGKSAVAINLLSTYPALPVRGAVVSGRMAPPGAPFTYPPDLQEALLRQVPDYVVDIDPSQGPQMRDMTEAEVWRRTLQTVDARTRAARYVLTHYDWDVATVIFTDTDMIQHFFWKYWDSTYPDHEPHNAFADALPQVYAACDRALGELIDLVGESTNVVLLSDHGFGPTYQDINLMAWLREEGFACPQQRGKTHLTLGEATARFRYWAWSVLPGWLIRQLKAHMPNALRREQLPEYESMGLDWTRTRAYALGMMGNVFVNLAGRAPKGSVAPGAEYEAVRDELIARLQAWRNPFTGQPMVKRAYRREEVLSGAQIDKAPDILIEWYDYAYTSRMAGHVQGPVMDSPKDAFFRHLHLSADHRPQGILALYGPAAREGVELSPSHLVDVAPTILHLLDEAIPTSLEGHVLTEALTDEYAATHTVRTCDVDLDQSGAGEGLSGAEAAMIQERLKNLGYVE